MYPLRAAIVGWSLAAGAAQSEPASKPAEPVTMALLLLQSPMAVQRLRAAAALDAGLVVAPLGQSGVKMIAKASAAAVTSSGTAFAAGSAGSAGLLQFSDSDRQLLRHAAASAPTPLATLSVLERAAAAEVATGGGVLTVGLPESLARRLDRVARGAAEAA